MEPIAAWLKQGLLAVGFTLLVIVGLLFFAVISVLLRPLLMAALLVAGLGAVILSCFSPRFGQWLDAES